MYYNKLQSMDVLFSIFQDILPQELIHHIVQYTGRVLVHYKPLAFTKHKIKELRRGKYHRIYYHHKV